MKLYLARHGNTFGPNDTVVYVGAKEDLPLVEKGEDQARELAGYFKSKNISIARAYSGELLRTKRSLEIVRENLSSDFPLHIDPNLNEISYGPWGALTVEEIEARGDGAALQGWQKQGIWPVGIFEESETEISSRVQKIMARIEAESSTEDAVLLVSSNGILRYFLKLIPHIFDEYQQQGYLAMKTGALSLLEKTAQDWNLVFWNRLPGDCSHG